MSTLYIVATPIGNLKDITLRALEVFRSVEVIVCEDTRVTRKLISHYDIMKPMISYHHHSGAGHMSRLVELIKEGKDLAYVSDAGTPGIQDPGNTLIDQLMSESVGRGFELTVVPIPGPSAVTALLSVSGLPTDSFLFLGFIPKKKGRKKALQEVIASERSVVFYESGHRIMKTLLEFSQLIDQLVSQSTRRVVVGRELTKRFETIYRGTVREVLDLLGSSSLKGEFAVIVEGQKKPL